jgi:hypothetical protein
MKHVKTQSQKQINYVLLFLASVSIGYSVVREFVFDKPDNGLLLVIGCCLLAGYSSTKHK